MVSATKAKIAEMQLRLGAMSLKTLHVNKLTLAEQADEAAGDGNGTGLLRCR